MHNFNWSIGYINTIPALSSSQPRQPQPLCPPPSPPSLSPVLLSPVPGHKTTVGQAVQLSHFSGGQAPAHPETLLFQNHSNSDVVSINCNVRLNPNQEINFHLLGNLWLRSLKAVSRAPGPGWKRWVGARESLQGRGQLLTRPLITQLKYKLMRITVHAALQRQFHSPFIFREEDPSRQVSIRNPADLGSCQASLGKGHPFPLNFPYSPCRREMDRPASSLQHQRRGETERDKQAIGTKVGKRGPEIGIHHPVPGRRGGVTKLYTSTAPRRRRKEGHLRVLHWREQKRCPGCLPPASGQRGWVLANW